MTSLRAYSFLQSTVRSQSQAVWLQTLCSYLPVFAAMVQVPLGAEMVGRGYQARIGTSYSPRHHAGSCLFTFTYGWSLYLKFFSLSLNV